MKKNIIYFAMGVVFLIFAVCIGYVFTEPTKTANSKNTPLQEQNAALLPIKQQIQTSPSADSLVFSAQDNTAVITTPPATKTGNEAKHSETSSVPPNREEAKQGTAFQTEPLNTEDQEITSKTSVTKESTTKENPTDKDSKPQAAAIENKTVSKTVQQEAKPVPLQDKLPVFFVEDSLKTRSVLSPKKKINTIVYTELMMDGNQVGLVFEGNKSLKPKTFRLNNPDRVVVDIEGYWALKLPRLISNRMVKEIRSSAQKDKTRIVFDLKVPVSSSLLYRIHSKKYQLVFK